MSANQVVGIVVPFSVRMTEMPGRLVVGEIHDRYGLRQAALQRSRLVETLFEIFDNGGPQSVSMFRPAARLMRPLGALGYCLNDVSGLLVRQVQLVPDVASDEDSRPRLAALHSSVDVAARRLLLSPSSRAAGHEPRYARATLWQLASVGRALDGAAAGRRGRPQATGYANRRRTGFGMSNSTGFGMEGGNMAKLLKLLGAGEGNRTLVISLEGF